MRTLLIAAAVVVAGCAPKPDAKDSAAAAVQTGVDSMAAHAESATHDSNPTGLKPTPPIFERNQRDSLGRPLPRPGTKLPVATRDSTIPTIPPGPPQLKVDTLLRKPPR